MRLPARRKFHKDDARLSSVYVYIYIYIVFLPSANSSRGRTIGSNDSIVRARTVTYDICRRRTRKETSRAVNCTRETARDDGGGNRARVGDHVSGEGNSLNSHTIHEEKHAAERGKGRSVEAEESIRNTCRRGDVFPFRFVPANGPQPRAAPNNILSCHRVCTTTNRVLSRAPCVCLRTCVYTYTRVYIYIYTWSFFLLQQARVFRFRITTSRPMSIVRHMSQRRTIRPPSLFILPPLLSLSSSLSYSC